MATNYIGPGDSLQYTAGATIAAGSPVVLGSSTEPFGTVGIAATDMVSGQTGTVYVKGIFEVTKDTHASSQAWVQGNSIYWDVSESEFTITATDNIYAGVAAEAAASTAAKGKILLNGVPARPDTVA